MPLQNRVTPEGEIIATEARGTMMGNRGGCLHGPDKTLGRRRWVTRQWICCELEFRGRRREVMAPGHYTELFFLDEATALAVGHRPCFECRRSDALRFASLWAQAEGLAERARAPHMDGILHQQRIWPDGTKRTVEVRLGELPDGSIVRFEGNPHLWLGGALRPWTPAGYLAGVRVGGDIIAHLLTPPAIVEVLRLGYRPRIHPSAGLAS